MGDNIQRVRTLAQGRLFRIEELPSGILVTTVWGEGTRDDLNALFDAYQPLLEAHAPVRTLTDVSGLGDVSWSARWAFAERMKENRRLIDKSAVIGLSPRLEVVLRVVLRVSRRTDLRTFDTRAAAEAWLLS